MPPITDIGPEPQHIRLVLSVTNHLGKTVTGICFNITVLPVDNQPPQVGRKLFSSHDLDMGVCKKPCGHAMFQVVTSVLTVDEGEESMVSLDNVLLLDVDSREEVLQVQLQREPRHGALQIGGLTLKPGCTFTVQDLKSLKVRSDILLRSFTVR